MKANARGIAVRQPPRSSGQPTAAFTLIELLVVVAIIALLISILLPSLQGARRQTRQLLCATNLRSMGQSALLYASENKDILVRGESVIVDGRGRLVASYHFAISLLRGLAYDGHINGLRTTGGFNNQRGLIEICDEIPQFQCPDFPEQRVEARSGRDHQALDYVVSAFASPYTRNNAMRDHNGGAPGQIFEPVSGRYADRATFTKLTDFDTRSNPARLIHITEAHVSLLPHSLQFHDLFYTSHLPFAVHPRIASDQRHARGINALFFDSHVETMRLQKMDAGWPQPRSLRLQWFTYVEDGVE